MEPATKSDEKKYIDEIWTCIQKGCQFSEYGKVTFTKECVPTLNGQEQYKNPLLYLRCSKDECPYGLKIDYAEIRITPEKLEKIVGVSEISSIPKHITQEQFRDIFSQRKPSKSGSIQITRLNLKYIDALLLDTTFEAFPGKIPDNNKGIIGRLFSSKAKV